MKTWFIRTLFSLTALFFIGLGLLLSPIGLKLSLKIAEKTLPGTLTYQKVHGGMLSPIEISSLNYSHQKLHLKIDHAYFKWHLPMLLSGKIAIENLQADNILINTAPQDPQTPSQEPEDKLTLPSGITIKQANLTNIYYQENNQAPLVITALQAKKFKLTHKTLRGKINISLEKPYQISSNITLTGTPQAYKLTLLTQYANQTIHLQANGNQRSTHLVISNDSIDHGNIDGSINISWQPCLRWKGTLTITALQLAELNKKLPTIKKMTLISSGSWQKTPRFDLNATLATSGGKLTVNGNYHDYWNLNWQGNITDLSTFYKPYRGSVNTQGSLSGNLLTPRINATINTNNLHINKLNTTSSKATMHIDLALKKPSNINLNATDINLMDYQQIKKLSLQLTMEQALKKINAKGSITSLTGQKIDVSTMLTGKQQGATWLGTLNALNVSSQHAGKWSLKRPSSLNVSRTQFTLAKTCLTTNNSWLCSNIDWHNTEPWHVALNAKLHNLTLMTQFISDNIAIDVPISLKLSASGKQHNIQQLSAAVNSQNGHISYNDGLQTYLLPIKQAIINIAKKNNHDLTTTTNITMSGKDHIHTSTTLLDFFNEKTTLKNQKINSKLQLKISNLQFLEAFLPAINNTKGTIESNANISGLLVKPSINGNAFIKNGYINIPKIKVRLQKINLNLNATGKLFSYKISANTEGQPINITGQSSFKGGKLITSIDVTGNNLLISNTPEYQIYASPDINIRIIGHGIVTSGTIIIPKATLKPADFSRTITLPYDAEIIGDTTEKNDALNWLLNIKVLLGKNIDIDSHGLTGHIIGSLDITRAQKQPSIVATGELKLQNATFSTQGKKLTISPYSNINYAHDLLANPHLDIHAYRTVTTASMTQNSPIGEKTDVGVAIQGTAKQPKITLFSSPISLSQADIISYLLFDQPASGDNSTGNLSLMIQAINSLKLSSKDSDFSISQIKQTLGITELGVQQQTYLDALGTPVGINQSSFVIGTRITPKIHLRYNRGIMTDINIYQARYLINNNWSMQMETYYGNNSWANGSGLDAIYTVSPKKLPW